MNTPTYEWLAASPEPSPEPFGSGDGFGMVSTLFQLFGYLAIILLLFYVAMKWVARSRSRVAGGSGRTLLSLGGLPLGTNKSVQVVLLGDRLYVLGVGDTITLLDTITDPEQVSQIREMFTREWSGGPAWLPKPLLDRLNGRSRGADASASAGVVDGPARPENGASFHELFESKLKGAGNRTRQVEQWLQEQQPREERRNEP